MLVVINISIKRSYFGLYSLLLNVFNTISVSKLVHLTIIIGITLNIPHISFN